MTRVGIPRALLFYYYYPMWKAFFTEIGVEIVVSPPTNKRILEEGLKAALDEACLPVKLYFGHVLALVGKVDYLFVPRIISVEQKAYICPKFMGLPDMLRARLRDLPPIIDIPLDLRRPENALDDFLKEVGHVFTRDRYLIKRAIEAAHRADQRFQELLVKGYLVPEVIEDLQGSGSSRKGVAQNWRPLKIGLLGHPYNIYDPFISMDLIGKLHRMAADVITGDNLPSAVIDEQTRFLPKRLFWSLSRKLVGAALKFFESENLDGVIYLTSFACGPESLVSELVTRWAKKNSSLPFMLLTVDEHTGEAGMVTRLEAFIEMIRWRKRNEDHLSAYGKLVHRY